MLKKTVGKNIRAIRKLKGFSQGELALRAGFTPSYWGYLERGQKNPSVELVEKVAAALEIEPYILFVDSSPGNLPSEITQLFYIISSMGQIHMKFIQDVLNAYIKAHKLQ